MQQQLFEACGLNGTAERLGQLLQERVNIEARNSYEQTPLMIVALIGDVETVRCLVENGATISDRSRCGFTALSFRMFFLYMCRKERN